jgi:hypothetical protein
MKMTRTKTRKGRRNKINYIERRRVRHTSERNETQTALHPTLTTRDSSHTPSTSLPSSPMSDIHASWQKIRRYVHMTLLSTSFSDEEYDDDVDYNDLLRA